MVADDSMSQAMELTAVGNIGFPYGILVSVPIQRNDLDILLRAHLPVFLLYPVRQFLSRKGYTYYKRFCKKENHVMRGTVLPACGNTEETGLDT